MELKVVEFSTWSEQGLRCLHLVSMELSVVEELACRLIRGFAVCICFFYGA